MFVLSSFNVLAQSTQSGSEDRIKVLVATYGHNLLPYTFSRGDELLGNATKDISSYCDNKVNCRYFVSKGYLGNPFPEEEKSYYVRYKCGEKVFVKEIKSEADHKFVDLNCSQK